MGEIKPCFVKFLPLFLKVSTVWLQFWCPGLSKFDVFDDNGLEQTAAACRYFPVMLIPPVKPHCNAFPLYFVTDLCSGPHSSSLSLL